MVIMALSKMETAKTYETVRLFKFENKFVVVNCTTAYYTGPDIYEFSFLIVSFTFVNFNIIFSKKIFIGELNSTKTELSEDTGGIYLIV